MLKALKIKACTNYAEVQKKYTLGRNEHESMQTQMDGKNS